MCKFTQIVNKCLYTWHWVLSLYSGWQTPTHTRVHQSVVGSVYCPTPSSVCPKETFYIPQFWHSLKSMCVCVCVSCDTTDQHMQFVRNWCHAVCTVSSYIHQPCPKTKPLTNCSRASTQVCGRFWKIFFTICPQEKKKRKTDSVFPPLDK